ncbi:hypothetical protein LTR91_013839 [Friedmanniomyces endolithicus]|uniref:DUF1754-domain-containing protein n=1 Tax=Friedmanniomyces endolithicus TaxID=329885 RepID=A0AAN6KCU8_9PEZI|nr:hypothetical protein LTS00_014375 [Friedmanniomyces endolithicus]KAK0283442.1 hypothetical protein LTR35_006517 [Friedmanniomyces endolithicus]KAK0310735.1 hypothetical protein LTR01_003890 [Friedmanniomyces endolithicus]KAK0328100.1 hypothetical protein LTR82_000027 [Friedmanniomyces endolithicus]KAK0823718.1 hypothetical protein LTR73_008298 [Friedmanniomyces endolithicus]
MPSSDYSSAVGGGLKLKGAKDAGIKKKKKKKSKPAEPTNSKVEEKSSDDTALQNALADEETSLEASGVEREGETKQYGKTEAQKRHDERRRKRLDERLEKEGIKTHKERVEELNKYLSGLSEHHDMPKIGPG